MYNKYMCICLFFTFSFFPIPFLITFYRIKSVGNFNFSIINFDNTEGKTQKKTPHSSF